MTLAASSLLCPVVILHIAEAQITGDEKANALRDRLLNVTAQAQAQNVILDFQDVEFLSSSGFRPLLSLHRALRQTEGKLLLCGLKPSMRAIFEAVRLISTKGSSRAPFEVYADVPAAVASLYQPAAQS